MSPEVDRMELKNSYLYRFEDFADSTYSDFTKNHPV